MKQQDPHYQQYLSSAESRFAIIFGLLTVIPVSLLAASLPLLLSDRPGLVEILAAATLAAAISMPATWYGALRPLLRARERADRTMYDVAESLSEGFQMYDPDDRLVMCNSAFRKMYSHVEHFYTVGRTFEEIFRDAVYAGQHPQAAGRVEAYIADRMRVHHEAPDEVIERQLESGCWVKITESRTSMGYTVGIRADISELKSREQALLEKEALLSSILENSPTSIALKDADGTYLYVNSVFEKRNGLAPGRAVGKTVAEIFPEKTAQMIERQDREVLTKKAPVIRELTIPKENAEPDTIVATKFPVMSVDGNVSAVGFILTDVTEARQREIELSEKTALLETVLETVPFVVVAMDNDGRITFASREAGIHFGVPANEMLGRTLAEILGDRYSQGIDDFIGEIRETGKPVNRPNHNSSVVAGKINWSIGSPIIRASGRTSGMLIIIMDVTEQQNALEQLARAPKMEGIGQLAAGIAHEINTPIQFIGNNLEFLHEAGDEIFHLADAFLEYLQVADAGGELSKVREKVDNALEEADIDYLKEELPEAIVRSQHGIADVARIVLSMKEFSHPSLKEKSPADINAALQNTALIARNEWKHIAALQEDLSDDLPEVFCYPGELNQVFLNMIVNAAHAIEDRDLAEPGVIGIRSTTKGNSVEIRISDTGVGLSEELRARVFEPFFTTKEVGKGTGQGLAISWDIIVNKHGGTIDIESEPGKGTTFIMTLPAEGQIPQQLSA